MIPVDQAVTQDASCLRGFLWNLDHEIPADLVVERLQAAGWSGTCLRGILWTFVDGAHNKVVFVPSTLRLQVRVDMMSAYDARRPVAVAVWHVIHDVEPPAG